MQNIDEPRLGCPLGHSRVLDGGGDGSPAATADDGLSNKPGAGGGATEPGAANGDTGVTGAAGRGGTSGAWATGASMPTTPASDTADVHSMPL